MMQIASRQLHQAIALLRLSPLQLTLHLHDSKTAPVHPLLPEAKKKDMREADPLLPVEDGADVEMAAEAPDEFLVTPGRAPLREILENANTPATVYVCGPGTFVAEVVDIAMEHGMAVHTETFLF